MMTFSMIGRPFFGLVVAGSLFSPVWSAAAEVPKLDRSTSEQRPNLSSIIRTRIGGSEVPVFPNTPNPEASFSKSGPWFYLTPIRIVKNEEPLYDSTSRTITIALETPYETAMAEDLYRARKAIATFYRARETTNTAISDEAVTLQRIPLTGYEISLSINGTEVPIYKRPPSDIPIDLVGRQTFTSKPIQEPAMQKILEKAHPGQVTVMFRAYYQMRKVVVTKVTASLIESALHVLPNLSRAASTRGSLSSDKCQEMLGPTSRLLCAMRFGSRSRGVLNPSPRPSTASAR